MSIKFSLLALLSAGPNYGYQLKAEFEERTGGTWPLNIGQVYTTLERLERDGLVARVGEDAEGRVGYEATPAGREAVTRWFSSAVDQTGPVRDELSVKLALAVTLQDVDVPALIQSQRKAAMLTLQDLSRARRGAGDIAWRLVLESRIYHTEAELRWLDHCEAAVLRGVQPRPVVPMSSRVDAEETTR